MTKTLAGYITVEADSGKPIACASTSSIWSSDATPAAAADSDTSAVELGVKFKSDVDGYICGIRFYKFSANTGTHVGSLWSGNGELLARATFANETASGWQQVNFDQPVTVKADTVYVASYYAPNGRYAADIGYFASAGVDNGSLHALGDGESGNNSVYLYGGGFPNYSWQSSNYWVDVAFSTGASSSSSWLEAGEITLNGGWQQVKFAKPFSDPVVVANPLNYDAAEPGVIRIRNVSATGFEIRSQTWDYLQGSSITGKVGYLVMERGSHTLDDGTQVEAGQVDTNLTGSFGQVKFAKPFSVAPVVITGVASVNEAERGGDSGEERDRRELLCGHAGRGSEYDADACDGDHRLHRLATVVGDGGRDGLPGGQDRQYRDRQVLYPGVSEGDDRAADVPGRHADHQRWRYGQPALAEQEPEQRAGQGGRGAIQGQRDQPYQGSGRLYPADA